MKEFPVPPPVIDDARVLEYATVDAEVRFTGTLKLFVGPERLGPVPRLAICETVPDGELLLFHCDRRWKVLGVQSWNSSASSHIASVKAIKERAERYYAGISSKWVSLGARDGAC